MNKLIIFDCDGVVRSFSWENVFLGYCEIAQQFGVSLIDDCTTVDAFRRVYSHDWRYNLNRMGIVAEPDVLVAEEIFREAYFTQVHMFDWVRNIIPRVAQCNTICIFTNSSALGVKRSLNGVMRYFAMTVGHEHVQRLKPQPDGIHFIMKKLQFSQEDTMMVGDSEADIVAGKAAGVATALVTWGATTHKSDIERLAADRVLNHPEELISL